MQLVTHRCRHRRAGRRLSSLSGGTGGGSGYLASGSLPGSGSLPASVTGTSGALGAVGGSVGGTAGGWNDDDCSSGGPESRPGLGLGPSPLGVFLW